MLLLSLALSLFPQQPRSVEVALTKVVGTHPGDVAGAQIPQPPFTQVTAGIGTTVSCAGRSLPLELADAGGQPPARAWIDANHDGARDANEEIALHWEDGTFATIDLRTFDCAAKLNLFRQPQRTIATLCTSWHFTAEIEHGGLTIGVRWVDMDASGTPSRGDRWLALPTKQLATIGMPNSMFAAHETDEPWHCGADELRITDFLASGRVQMRFQPPIQPRHEFLAARNARVAAWFDAQFDTERESFYAEHHIDAGRPTATPVAWYHTLEFADAKRFAAREGKPLLVEWSRDGCAWCKRLPWVTYRDAAVVARLARFACVRIDTELDPEQTAEALGLRGVPQVVVFDEKGTALHTIRGFQPPVEFAAELDRASGAVGLPPLRN